MGEAVALGLSVIIVVAMLLAIAMISAKVNKLGGSIDD
jgi:hypothetical protein